MTLVRTSVARPFVVHVVDATSNLDGFEHACTTAICAALRAANVPLTPSSPHLAMDMQALGEAFAIEETWSVLLFVSHGEREPGETADYVRLGDHDATWFMLHGIDLRLTDKAAFLCVCDGDCDDARWTLVREQLGLIMVAPSEKITDAEARAFFPAVLQELYEMQIDIAPEHAKYVVGRHAAVANGKMVVRSGV